MTARADLVDLRLLPPCWRVKRDGEGLPVITARRGWVAAHDRDTVCVHLRGRRLLLAALRSLPAGWRRHQVGDDEANLLAPLADLDRACRLVRAYRRPILTDEERTARSERARTAKLWASGAQKSTIAPPTDVWVGGPAEYGR